MVDELIVMKAINGDDDAFMLLINEHKERLYRTAYAYVKEEEAALDIVQETVYKAYISINKLREPKYFTTWIIKIVINISINMYKERQKVICIEQNELLNKAGGMVEDNDNRLYILEAIEKLESKYKDIIILKYFNDLTLPEISRVLDLPIGTAKTYLNKGLKILRNYMKKEAI